MPTDDFRDSEVTRNPVPRSNPSSVFEVTRLRMTSVPHLTVGVLYWRAIAPPRIPFHSDTYTRTLPISTSTSYLSFLVFRLIFTSSLSYYILFRFVLDRHRQRFSFLPHRRRSLLLCSVRITVSCQSRLYFRFDVIRVGLERIDGERSRRHITFVVRPKVDIAFFTLFTYYRRRF